MDRSCEFVLVDRSCGSVLVIEVCGSVQLWIEAVDRCSCGSELSCDRSYGSKLVTERERDGYREKATNQKKWVERESTYKNG